MNLEILKSCIVTPDIIGPIKNGGIGTHCFYLAKFLALEMKQDVTILFTSIFETGTSASWRDYYQSNFGIDFVWSTDLACLFNGPTCGANQWFVERSQRIYRWLSEQHFDVCYFQDWHANGFASIQAKRTGQAFERTTLVCMTHSSSEWIREGMQQLPKQSTDELLIDYAERYCLEFADHAISPSNYMFEWAEEHGWKINHNRKILPYLFETELDPIEAEFDGQHIVFFGRLETRKGLEVYLRALQLLAPELRTASKHIRLTFLGKNGLTHLGEARVAIPQFLAECLDVYEFDILTDYSQPEALNFLCRHANALVVTPSLSDNLPFAVIESIELNINIIAANTGGIPEMFADSSRLFSPNPKAFAAKLRECLLQGLPPLNKAYSSRRARTVWQQFCEQLTVHKKNLVAPAGEPGQLEPKVSICVPYYNCGEYLPDLLESIERQTYRNFEVIVVDDGSTDASSLRTFSQMQDQYRDRRWLFLTKENGGPGSARNCAVAQSTGQYIVFMDADNAAETAMLERMVWAMEKSRADCLTCYSRGFGEFQSPFLKEYKFAYYPIGACAEASLYENYFGDTNFIIKKSTFLALGGFRESRDVNHEDWELLAKLVVEGYTLDTIPDFLFLYRHREGGFSRTTNGFRNYMAGIKPLLESLPWWARRHVLNSVGCTRQHTLTGQQSAQIQQELQQQSAQIQQELQQVQQLRQRELLQLRHQLAQAEEETGRLRRQLDQSWVYVDGLKAVISGMESSKFWKLRIRWFGLKRVLGLPILDKQDIGRKEDLKADL
ncbi:glycosyltransferase [Gloeobacter morelensis]|uniref:Glycosyltransferase n=1 Tax=Gloeobacter morelensis MG652769 TaxID=2781736 RepID=A0ABY3PHE5_9CYAN|nr:glycosyltransferase [Gloeobacter morelensis]UFP93065.1 glycosyltransferase [Gloeobacter morelensis MG652769]